MNNSEYRNYSWIWVCLLILLLTVNVNYTPTTQAATQEVHFDTVTIKTETYETTLRAKTIKENYDESGKLSYLVSFYIGEFDYTIECNIPEEYEDRLSKEAVYNGTITVGYIEEPITTNENIDLEEVDISTLVKSSKKIRMLNSVSFMYSDYITSGLNTLEEIHDTFETKYTQTVEESES